MLNRWIGILAAAGMILTMAAIFTRDVLPYWMPDETPPTEAELLVEDEARYVQYGIFDDTDERIGRSWTSSKKTGDGRVVVSTSTVLGSIHLPNGMRTPPVRIETMVTYRGAGDYVDDFEFRLHGLGIPITCRGEAYASDEFACHWQVGPREDSFLLDSRAPTLLSDVIRPFHRLPRLYVGQTWRLDILDPLAQLFPQVEKVGLNLEPIQVTVTGREPYEHQGRSLDAFIVESEGATAWVAPDGRVLRQEVSIPVLGELYVLLEDSCICYDGQDVDCCVEMREARRQAGRGFGPSTMDNDRIRRTETPAEPSGVGE